MKITYAKERNVEQVRNTFKTVWNRFILNRNAASFPRFVQFLTSVIYNKIIYNKMYNKIIIEGKSEKKERGEKNNRQRAIRRLREEEGEKRKCNNNDDDEKEGKGERLKEIRNNKTG